MANVASKKIHAQNIKTLEQLKKVFVGVNGYFILVRLIYQYSSLTFFSILGYIIIVGLSWVIFFQLNSISQSRFFEGRLVGSGEDLSAKGLTSYMFDVLYVTWFVQVTTTFANFFWYFYLVIPGYAFYKFVTLALLPFIRSRSSMNNAVSDPSSSSEPSTSNQNVPKSKTKKMY